MNAADHFHPLAAANNAVGRPPLPPPTRLRLFSVRGCSVLYPLATSDSLTSAHLRSHLLQQLQACKEYIMNKPYVTRKVLTPKQVTRYVIGEGL